METAPAYLGLPGRGEEIAQLQERAGRQALTGDQRALLAKLHEEAATDPEQTVETTLTLLLTRAFSREPIPEYYRYANLHVYGWFLDQHRADPVTGAVLALDAALADLEAVERRAAPGLTEADHTEERLRRLAEVREHVARLPVAAGRPGTAAEALARADGTVRRNTEILLRCSGFLASGHHHENIFLRVVQACELAFYLIRHLTVRARTAVGDGDGSALDLMVLLTHYAELPNRLFHVLRTLTPDLFLTFRDATGEASAVQSLNYHLMELVIYGYDGRKAEAYLAFDHLHPLTRPPLRSVRSLRDTVVAAGDPDLTEALAEVERTLLTWRGRHYGFGRRYLPGAKGSGGTEGAGYLKRFVHKDDPAAEPWDTVPGPDLLGFAFR